MNTYRNALVGVLAIALTLLLSLPAHAQGFRADSGCGSAALTTADGSPTPPTPLPPNPQPQTSDVGSTDRATAGAVRLRFTAGSREYTEP